MRPPREQDPSSPPAELVVASDHSGLTLAAVVREILPGTSWSRARDLCRQGRVTVDGYPADDPAQRVAAGERIAVRLAGPPVRRELLGSDALVHVDPEVAVVRKPAGLLSVPFTEEDRDTLVTLARAAIARRGSGRGPGPRLRVVQRLDKETSGLLVFARTVDAERHLQAQFRQHSVTRRYLALVHGEAADATYETLLVPDRGDGLRGSWGVFRRARGKPPETARQAVTHVEVEEVLAGASLVGASLVGASLVGASLVSCRLETGRQHQIRIHLAG